MASPPHTIRPVSKLRLLITGMCMGTVDLVPGVSGGTVAFVAGIYEDMLAAAKRMTGPVPMNLVRLRFREAWRMAPLGFVVPLLSGMFIAIFSLSHLLAYLLDNHSVLIWALFWGLIAASVLVVIRRVRLWTRGRIAGCAIATVVTYMLVGLAPATIEATPLNYFLGGAIAISAMILPGISGSFILVIMGMYDNVLDALNRRDFAMLGIFIAGTLVGLAMFARVLSWLFSRYHDTAVAVLIGVILGSMRKVWPWRQVVETREDRHGEVVPVLEVNVLPPLSAQLGFAILLMFAGAMLVLWLESRHTIDESSGELEPGKP